MIHFTDALAQQITGVVASRPLHHYSRTKFILKANDLKTGTDARPIQGRIRVTVYGEHPPFKRGDVVRLEGRLKPIRNFNNPGAFDYQAYMAFKGVWVSASASGRTLTVEPQAEVAGFIQAMDRTRDRITALIGGIASERVSPASKAVLNALLVGDRSRITPEWRMVFNRSGVGHLLAISGLHIGIIAVTAFGLLRRLLSFWPIALRRAWVVKLAAGLTLIPVMFYGLLAGMSPSTQRALIMVGVFLIARVIEKEQDLVNSLCVAALLILIVNPPALFSISFQLSFAAVLGILLGFNFKGDVFMRPASTVWDRIRKAVISMGLASLFAILGTLPLVMHYFNLVLGKIRCHP